MTRIEHIGKYEIFRVDGVLTMFVCTTGINEPFDVIRVIVGFASAAENIGGINLPKVYDTAMARLWESGAALGADGVIGVGFQNRFAVGKGCGGPHQVFEVVAFGTAIKLRR